MVELGKISSFPTTRRHSRATLKHIASQFLAGGLDRTGQGQTTFFYTLPVPDHAYAVRFIFGNIDGSNTFALTGLCYQASDTVNDYIVPTNGPGWKYCTAANSGAIESGTDVDLPRDPASSLGGATNFPLTIAVNSTYTLTGATNLHALMATDWNYLDTVDPVSGPAKFLMMRVLGPSQIWRGVVQSTNTLWSGQAVNQGYDWKCMLKAGDFITSPGDAVASPGNATAHPLVAVQFLCAKGVVNVMAFGDSHFAGDSTSGGFNSFLTQACFGLSTTRGEPVMPVNCGWGGANSNTFWPGANQFIPIARPSVVFLQGWTANDSITTQAGADKYFARLLATAERVREAGGVPVFVTPFPRDAASMTGSTLTQWLYLRNRIIAMRNAGATVLDAGALLGSTTAATYTPANTTDNIHPNDTGHGLVAAAAKTIIEGLVGPAASLAA